MTTRGRLPPDPARDRRFAGIPSDYPGGSDAYWRDYDRAAELRDREKDRRELKLTVEQYEERERYYALKTEVHALVEKLAATTGQEPMSVNTALVRTHGFPWRNACTSDDFERMRDHLNARIADESPDNR